MKDTKFPPPIFEAIPTDVNDRLRIDIVSAITPLNFILEGVAVDFDEKVVPLFFSFSVTTANVLQTETVQIGYKYILSAVLHTVTDSIPDGACYARLAIVRPRSQGRFPFRKILAQGYITTIAGIGYGSQAINGSPGPHDHLVGLDLVVGGLGNQATFICPDFQRITILSTTFLYNSGVAVANRFAQVSLTLPPANPFVYFDVVAQTAAQTISYMFSSGLGQNAQITAVFHGNAMPILVLEPGAIFNVSALNADPNDAVSNASFLGLRQIIPFT